MTKTKNPIFGLTPLEGSKDAIKYLEKILPVFRDVEDKGIYVKAILDLESVKFLAHCIRQYGVKERNNPMNKFWAAIEVKKLHNKGKTLQQIADYLNAHGFKTSRGKQFHRSQVNRLLKGSKKYIDAVEAEIKHSYP